VAGKKDKKDGKGKNKRGAKPVKAPLKAAAKKPNSSAKAKPGKAATPAAGPSATVIKSTREFFLDDLPKTLFPLETNRVLVELGETEIREYVKKCLDDQEAAYGFLPQKRVFVSKPHGYLRRTVKLDVVAEYYLYDLVYRNRALFRKPHTAHRTHYGYRFESRVPIAPTNAYKGFKGGLAAYGAQYAHSRSMDVATYFNSLYHHDIVAWFHDRNASHEDAEGLGQLLREIVGGRSVDCLPQGLYPAKMIGNDFLRFVEEFHDLKADQVIRFMDDIVLFANDEQAIDDDFQTVQRLIGDKGLSLNSRKTRVNEHKGESIDNAIHQVKKELLRRRRIVITTGYDEDGAEIIKKAFIKVPLTSAEMAYIEAILDQPDIEEEDAELLLTIMRGYANRLEKRLPYIIETYPHLAKNVHGFCAGFEDKEVLADMLLGLAKKHDRMPESQLFWFCAILADELMSTSKASSLISVLFNHRSATVITKAKILEINDVRFGLQDLRNEHLANGQSDWLGWASAVGSRSLKPASRNHRLKYWAKGSNMNHLVASIILNT
jgi:hypothetical protein